MTYFVWILITFHILPLIVFVFSWRILGRSKLNLFISCVIFSSLLADLFGVWLSLSGVNTTPVLNSYQIVERIVVTLILNSVSPVSSKIKKLVLLAIVFISIWHLLYCFFNGFQSQNDYIKLFSRTIICFYALFTLYILLSNLALGNEKVVLDIWPVLAVFVYSSSMFIPQMITSIDDSVKFPVVFHEVRRGVTVGSNIIRDSLFAIFFCQAKKMSYDTGK